jgi:hypothetical protein
MTFAAVIFSLSLSYKKYIAVNNKKETVKNCYPVFGYFSHITPTMCKLYIFLKIAFQIWKFCVKNPDDFNPNPYPDFVYFNFVLP